jgi:acylphosphatase
MGPAPALTASGPADEGRRTLGAAQEAADVTSSSSPPAGDAGRPSSGAGGAERLQAQVRGRVQGVGFRFFVQEEAARLGLTGYVRNASDGRRVEVVAEGPRASLERLLAALHRGPPMAFVERVDVTWLPARGELAGFDIRH